MKTRRPEGERARMAWRGSPFGAPGGPVAPLAAVLENTEKMGEERPAGEEDGRWRRSCAALWARTGQKTLQEETIRSEAQRWSFRSVRYREAAGLRGLCGRLHRLCRRWLQPERRTKAQMLDRVTLERLLAALPPEMQSWVQECGVETSCQAVALAEGFLLSRAEEEEEQEREAQRPFLESIVKHPKGRRDLSDLSQKRLFRV